MTDRFEHRRLRALELRDWECRGSNAAFAARIERADNYVSRMLADPSASTQPKRVGERMADLIVEKFGLPPGWLDMPLGTPIEGGHSSTTQFPPPAATYPLLTRPSTSLKWPFVRSSFERIEGLRLSLGAKRAQEAYADMDELLDIALTRWEARAAQTAGRTGVQQ